jgi:cell division cycle protein 20 (cofactor of APC complex)
MSNNNMYPPKTPPRAHRSVRGSNLAPTPFVTPSKKPSLTRPRTLFKHESPSANRTPQKCKSAMQAPSSYGRPTPSNNNYHDNANTPDQQDRFIPSRRHTNLDLCRRALLSSADKRPRVEGETPLQKEFKRRMLSSLCNASLDQVNEECEPTSGLLSLFGNNNNNHNNTENQQSSTYAPNPFALDFLRAHKVGSDAAYSNANLSAKILRKVPGAPYRILDAPDIVDDYYLNLISWSKDNILAVALAQSVYLWNAGTGDIHHLVTMDGTPSDYVTSVCWCTLPGQTKYIAIGTNSFQIQLFDTSTLRKLRTFLGHSGRVSSLAWNQQWLTSGSRDSTIRNFDIRAPNALSAKYVGHQQEVCGLKWNEDGSCLASGGNENYLCLWDAAMSGRGTTASERARGRHLSDLSAPRLILRKHKAAVKALDWCPFHRGLLASGGGTSDRTIKFWNSSSGAMLNSIDTGSQVCSILWSKHQRELCSSHGYSENQLILWKYPTMTRVKELPGHTARVLNMEMSPDGTSVVSAAADETLRFWNVFGGTSASTKGDASVISSMFGTPGIR